MRSTSCNRIRRLSSSHHNQKDSSSIAHRRQLPPEGSRQSHKNTEEMRSTSCNSPIRRLSSSRQYQKDSSSIAHHRRNNARLRSSSTSSHHNQKYSSSVAHHRRQSRPEGFRQSHKNTEEILCTSSNSPIRRLSFNRQNNKASSPRRGLSSDVGESNSQRSRNYFPSGSSGLKLCVPSCESKHLVNVLIRKVNELENTVYKSSCQNVCQEWRLR